MHRQDSLALAVVVAIAWPCTKITEVTASATADTSAKAN